MSEPAITPERAEALLATPPAETAGDDLPAMLAARRPTRRLPPLTTILGALVLLAAGTAGGAWAQKRWGTDQSAAAGAARSPGSPAARAAAGGGAAPGAGRTGATGATGGFGARAGGFGTRPSAPCAWSTARRSTWPRQEEGSCGSRPPPARRCG